MYELRLQNPFASNSSEGELALYAVQPEVLLAAWRRGLVFGRDQLPSYFGMLCHVLQIGRATQPDVPSYLRAELDLESECSLSQQGVVFTNGRHRAAALCLLGADILPVIGGARFGGIPGVERCQDDELVLKIPLDADYDRIVPELTRRHKAALGLAP